MSLHTILSFCSFALKALNVSRRFNPITKPSSKKFRYTHFFNNQNLPTPWSLHMASWIWPVNIISIILKSRVAIEKDTTKAKVYLLDSWATVFVYRAHHNGHSKHSLATHTFLKMLSPWPSIVKRAMIIHVHFRNVTAILSFDKYRQIRLYHDKREKLIFIATTQRHKSKREVHPRIPNVLKERWNHLGIPHHGYR